MTDFKTFKDLSQDEQQALVTKISDCLKEAGCADAKINVDRQEVVVLKSDKIESDTMVSVVKHMPAEDDAKAQDAAKKVKAILEAEKVSKVKVDIKAKIAAGDPYKTITGVVDINNADTPVELAHVPGQVWLIDFWATWCPPCQAPMAHNQQMLENPSEDWGDKVRILGVSIDQSAAAVVKHVDAKGWKKIEHYHRAKSDCSDVYEVSGVPHVMLIDTEGKIAFKGHPANRKDLKADFSALLRGEKLTGEGCGAAVAAATDGAEPAFDAVAMSKNLDDFMEQAKTMQADLKGKIDDMPRCFCVMVSESSFTPSTGTWTGSATNHRVLVGKQEQIDECEKMIKERVTGDYYEVKVQK